MTLSWESVMLALRGRYAEHSRQADGLTIVVVHIPIVRWCLATRVNQGRTRARFGLNVPQSHRRACLLRRRRGCRRNVISKNGDS